MPLRQNLDRRLGFLGQFSPVNRVELRAQVGGVLTEIHFQDGQIVRKGDLLFVIDPRPYEIKLALATAQLATAMARVDLTSAELARAQSLRKTDAGSQETVDQGLSDQNAAQALCRDRVVEEIKRREGTSTAEHLKLVLSAIDSPLGRE